MQNLCEIKAQPFASSSNMKKLILVRLMLHVYSWEYDIDIHPWNLEPFKKFKFLNEISFKKCFFLHLFSNKCAIISFLRKKPILYQRGGNFINGHCIFFSLFLFGNVSWIPKWGLMAIEKMLHISYTLILSNLLHLTVGSKLILIQNELWVPKCRHANFLILFLFFCV